jgi:ATP dependent DNA ligase C terminal region
MARERLARHDGHPGSEFTQNDRCKIFDRPSLSAQCLLTRIGFHSESRRCWPRWDESHFTSRAGFMKRNTTATESWLTKKAIASRWFRATATTARRGMRRWQARFSSFVHAHFFSTTKSWHSTGKGFHAFSFCRRAARRPHMPSSSKWLKVKVHQEEELVIGGFTKPEGSRRYFGALLLGAYEDGKLRYVGKVGTGFNENTLASLYRKFKTLVHSRPAFVDPPRGKGITYLKPKLVAQISFQEWTADRKLRQPVFLGLRDDKRPEEVQLPAKGTV